MKVCMLAYATYFTDARIKAYVKSLETMGIWADVISLREEREASSTQFGHGKIYYLSRKYQGGSSLRYVLSYLLFFLKASIQLLRGQFKNNYDVIHVHNMPNFIVFAALIPRVLGSKIILDVHDLMTANYMTKFGVDERHWLIRLLKIEQVVSGSFADYIICADHMQKKELYNYGLRPEKITVLMNVANEEVFVPVHRKKDVKWFNLVYHGTIAERLGIDILLRAMAIIKDEFPVFLSAYGEGDFLEDCLRLRKELGLNGSVYFSESFFPVEKIPKIVGNMDAGIVPNRKTLATDKFMMPVKLMEYVYLQIPVIAPRLQIIQYYFDNTMVKFFEPGNAKDLARAIVELYENPEERKNLVLNANKFIEKHNWKSQEKEYARLLTALVA